MDGYVPDVIRQRFYHEEIHTPENRFLKYFIESLDKVINNLLNSIDKKDGYIIDQLLEYHKLVQNYLSDSWTSKVGLLEYLPLNSQILQKKEGYRDIFKYYINFELAFRLEWQELEDQIRGYERKLANYTNTGCYFNRGQGQVGRRHGQGVLGHVGGPDLGARCSVAMARAMAPDPVPRSATRAGPAYAGQLSQGDLHNDLGFGPGYEHPAVDHEVEVAKGPMAEHVLHGLSRPPGAPAERQRPAPPGPGRPRPAPPARCPRRLLHKPPGRLTVGQALAGLQVERERQFTPCRPS